MTWHKRGMCLSYYMYSLTSGDTNFVKMVQHFPLQMVIIYLRSMSHIGINILKIFVTNILFNIGKTIDAEIGGQESISATFLLMTFLYFITKWNCWRNHIHLNDVVVEAWFTTRGTTRDSDLRQWWAPCQSNSASIFSRFEPRNTYISFSYLW